MPKRTHEGDPRGDTTPMTGAPREGHDRPAGQGGTGGSGTVRVATCQFPTSGDIAQNATWILQQLREAHTLGADVAHYPEAGLSGYAGSDIDNLDLLDWALLRDATREVQAAAGELGIWVVLGSTHRLSGNQKPHNSLYIIDAAGTLRDRYDKRFCAGEDDDSGDLAHYSPGNHHTVFTINGIRCGALICHDYRYPELYRAYRKADVSLVFHSYHAAHISPEQLADMREAVGAEHHELNPGDTYPAITMPASMIAAAAANHVWISAPNSCAPESCWGSFFVRADGIITGQLERNQSGILISDVDPNAELYDSTRAWRGRAIDGTLHSGTLPHSGCTDGRSHLWG